MSRRFARTPEHRARLLDLCCGAGGAAKGYQRAGWHVTGVDLAAQPNYCGDEFVQADALGFLARYGRDFHAVHTSFPCQTHCGLTKGNRVRGWVDDHRDLIGPGRVLLDATGLPYVLENVPGSPVRRDVTLCGEMFGLAVIRHRWFELGRWTVPRPVHRPHRGRVSGMRHGRWFTGPYFAVYGDGGGKGSVADWQTAMGIDWTTVRREIAEAIPPAYTEHIGRALLAVVTGSADGVAP